MNLFNGKFFFLLLPLLLTGCNRSEDNVFPGYSHGELIYLSHFNAEKIDRLLVNKGDAVRKGQPLVKMDSFILENALQQAEKNYQAENALLQNLLAGERTEELDILQAQLKRARSAASLAESQHERYQQLYQAHVISKAELERYREEAVQKTAQVTELLQQLKVKKLPARQAEIDTQKSRVESAKLQQDKAYRDLQQSILIAPQDARVYDILYRPGERPAAGRPIISLLPPENIKVRFFIPAKKLGALHIGTKVNIFCDGCKAELSGSVSYIHSQAEYTPPVIYSTNRREKLVFMAEASLTEEDVKYINPGQPVRVEIVADE